MTWNKYIIAACLALGIYVSSPALASNSTDVRNDGFAGAWTGGTLNTSWAGYGLGGTSYQSAQIFIPEHSNISRLHVVCGKNFGQSLIGKFYICKGSPDATHFDGSGNYLPCSSAGSVLIASTSDISVYCNYGNSETIVTIATPVSSFIPHYFEFISTSTITTNAFRTVATGKTAFSLDYETTFSQSPTFSITSPVNGYVSATDNNIEFIGSVSNATELQILWGTPNASPANEITGLNLQTGTFDWNYNVQIPNGSWWIWYIAKQGTTTITATTSLTVAVSETNVADVSISSSSISTTTAYAYLASTTINCASSAPAFISDPATLYTENSPIFNFASTTEQSYYMDLANNTSKQLVLATSTTGEDRKIEEITIVQETSPTNIVHVYCNNTEIADNRSQDFYDVTMNYHCDDAIYVDKSTAMLGVAITIKYAITANGTSTVPKFYNFVTTGIYSVIKIPTDMANKLSCYLSADVAKQKGQGAGTMLGYWAQFTRGIDQIFPIPMFSIIQIWIIGLVVWFSRKLLPWFK